MFTLDQMIDAVKAEVEGNEDYIYPGAGTGFCNYVENTAPSCLIGRALYRLGLSVGQLEGFDKYNDSSMGSSIRAINARFRMLDESAEQFALTVQRDQDGGHPWGQALEHGLLVVDRA